MAIDFPNSPTTNQLFQSGDKTWQWDGEKWIIVSVTSSVTVLPILDDQVILALRIFS